MLGNPAFLLLSSFCLFCLSSASPTPSAASPLGDIFMIKDGAELPVNVTAEPAGMRYQVVFREQYLLNTLQAENVIVATLAKMARKNMEEYIERDITWKSARFPEVGVRIEPRGPVSIKMIHVLWALYHLHLRNVNERGANWVMGINNVFLGENLIGTIALLPNNAQLTLQGISNASSVTDTSNSAPTAIPDFSKRMSSSSSSSDSDVELSCNSSFPSSSTTPTNDDNDCNSTSSDELTAQRTVTTSSYFKSQTSLGEQNLYLMYSNTIVGLADTNPFSPGLLFRIKNPRLGVELTIYPPMPPRIRSPMNTKNYSIQVIAQTAIFTANERRFDELQTVGIVDGIIIQNTLFEKCTGS